MHPPQGGGWRHLLARALVPMAHEDDARATATALAPSGSDRVTTLHVVEKGAGVPDRTPVEQSEQVASDGFDAVRETFPDAGAHTAYARDVVGASFEAADEVGASAVGSRSRDGGRVEQFLSGDLSLKLVTGADRPVVALPGGVDRTSEVGPGRSTYFGEVTGMSTLSPRQSRPHRPAAGQVAADPEP